MALERQKWAFLGWFLWFWSKIRWFWSYFYDFWLFLVFFLQFWRYFLRQKNTSFWTFTIYYIYLAAEGDTADRVSEVPAAEVRGADAVRIEVQVVGATAIVADRGPVGAAFACVVQVVTWADVTAPDKHQRRLHNSIRISWGLGDEVGEATVGGGVASGEGEAFQEH